MPRTNFLGLRGLRSYARKSCARISPELITREIAFGGLSTIGLPKGVPKRSDLSALRTGIRQNELHPSLQSFMIRSLRSEPRICAPVLLGPILAFIKSSSIVKAFAVTYSFIKSSFIAKLFGSAVAYLKSGSIFKVLSVSSRVVLGIVSTLKLQARRILRWWHGDADFRAINAARDEAFAEAGGRRIPHFHRTTKYLLAIPAVILAFALVASLERTPLWGRWRFIMMNADEEALLIEDFLKPGSRPGSHLDSTVPRDWVAILRNLGDANYAPPGTVEGFPVLDPLYDWRAKWVMDVFMRLEDGVKRLNLTSDQSDDRCDTLEVGDACFAAPPVAYPLTIRPAALKHHGRGEEEDVEGPLVTRYGCVVLDAPVYNASSIGFGPGLRVNPDRVEEAPGVICVYSGLLDEIMRGRQPRPEEANASVAPPRLVTSSNPIVGLFSTAVAPYSQARGGGPMLPTKREDEELAAILAHELGHLLLSHTIETLSSDNMYDLLTTILTDLIRTALYPLTAFLGPAFNDWFGSKIRINSDLGLRVTNNCNKRRAEREADLLSLRILLGAGINPRVALDVWAEGGLFDRIERREQKELKELRNSGSGSSDGGIWESEMWLAKNGFMDSHPVNEKRRKDVAEELENWAELGRQLKRLHDDEADPGQTPISSDETRSHQAAR